MWVACLRGGVLPAEAIVHRAPRSRRPPALGMGEPLPANIRAQVEGMFGVELDAIRVHSGDAAQGLLERECATGLSFGTEVLLAGEASDPALKPVLLHEIVHVLQQTATLDQNGAWRCTRGFGAGPAQPFTKPSFSAAPPAIGELLDDHAALSAADASVVSAVSALRGALAAPSTTPTAVPSAVALVLKSAKSGSASDALASLAYDLSKQQGRYVDALGLLDARPGLTTTFHDEGMIVAARKRKSTASGNVPARLSEWAWVDATWRAHPKLQRAGPKAFLASLLRPLLEERLVLEQSLAEMILPLPSGAAPGTKPATQLFEPWITAELAATTGKHLDHELYLMTAFAVGEFDNLRRAMLNIAASQAKGLVDAGRQRALVSGVVELMFQARSGAFALERKNEKEKKDHLAGASSEDLRLIRESETDDPLLAVLVALYAGEIAQATGAARQAWQAAVQALTLASIKNRLDVLDQSVGDFLSFVRRAPELAKFRSKYLDIVSRMLANSGEDKDRIPPRAEYAARVNSLGLELRQLDADEIEPALLANAASIRDEIVAGRDWKQKVPLELLAARVFAQRVTRWLREQISSYNAAEDATREQAQHKQSVTALEATTEYKKLEPAKKKAWLEGLSYAADYRAKHRIELARLLDSVATRMSWSELSAALDPVLVAPALDLSAPGDLLARALILTGDWSKSDVTFDRILNDINPHAMLQGLEPLSVLDVYHFLRTLDFAATSASIQAKLKPGGTYLDAAGNPRTDLAPDQTIPYALDRERKQRLMPERWTLSGVDFTGDVEQYRLLIFAHPKTRVVLLNEENAGRTQALTTTGKTDPALLWFLPPFAALFSRLRKDPAIDGFLRKYSAAAAALTAKAAGKPLDSSSEAPPLPAMNDGEWSDLFLKALLDQQKQAKALRAKAKPGTQPKADEEEPPTALELAVAATSGQLKTEYDQAYQKLIADYRAEAIVTRKYYTEVWLRPLVQKTKGSWSDSIDIRGQKSTLRVDVPERLLGLMIEASIRLAPYKDQAAHVMAMMASLAPDLKDNWSSITDYAMFVKWKPIIEHAMSVIQSPSSAVLKNSKDEDLGSTTLNDVQDNAERAAQSSNLADLQALNASWVKSVRAIVRDFGVSGGKGTSKAPRGYVQPTSGGNSVLAGKGEASVFQIDGIPYALIDVYEDFTYFHSYRPDSPLGQRDASGKVTRDPADDASMLFLGSGSAQREIPAFEQHRTMPLFKYKRDGVPKVVLANDDQALAEFSLAVALHSNLVSLEALADALETAAGVIMDALELIPGAGQAIAAARIATAVLSFMSGGQFDALMKILHNPREELEKGYTFLKDRIFNVEHLWEFLLLARIHLRPPKPKEVDAGELRNQKSGKLKRLLSKIGQLASRLIGLFIRFQRGMVARVDAARMFVLKRPFIARIVAFLARVMPFFSAINWRELFDLKLEDVIANVRAGVRNLGARVRGFFAHIAHIEVPKTIIPLGAILEVIVDLLVSRLGGKYKYAAKGFLEILELAGQKRRILDAIGKNFEGTAVDPNKYLSEELAKLIEDPVHDAAQGLFGMLKDSLGPKVDAIAGSNDFSEGLGELPAIKVEPVEGEEIESEADGAPLSGDEGSEPIGEVEAKLARDRAPEGVLPPLPSRSSGSPLADAQRLQFESRLGQDLGHVRVHSDVFASRLTSALAAHAATSGSHVFLGSGVDLGTTRGDHVFRHELGHVLQQTGPRPLGATLSASPRLGRADAGLTIDPAREAMADRIADATGPGSMVAPLRAQPAGLEPSLLDGVVTPLLQQISSPEALVARALKDERSADSERSLSPEQQKQLAGVWSAVRDAVKTEGVLKLAPSYGADATKDAIRQRFKSQDANIKHGLDDAAAEALVELKPAEKGDTPLQILDPDRLRTELTGEIFGVTGILLELDFKKANIEVPGAQRSKQPWLDEANPVLSIKVVNVDLADVHGADGLWKLALANTLATHATLASDDLWGASASAEGAAKVRARLRPVLREHRPGGDVWESKAFAFTQKIIEEVKKAVSEGGKASRLEPSNLPAKADYLDIGRSGLDKEHNIGLRIGRFVQHKTLQKSVPNPQSETIEAKGQQKGVERESHHTTQFLLLEFFRNDVSMRPAFPLLKESGAGANQYAGQNVYPGVTASGGFVDQFASARKFFIKDFWEGRGGLMPAVLLARMTHRTARLHVTTSSVDFDGQNDEPFTQSGIVSGKFHNELDGVSALGKEYVAEEAKAKKPLVPGSTVKPVGGAPPGVQGFQAWVATKGPDQIRGLIESAMLGVYRWMYNEVMEPALRRALPREEADYYNELAEAAGRSDRLESGDMSKIADLAKQNNLDVMKKAGFEL